MEISPSSGRQNHFLNRIFYSSPLLVTAEQKCRSCVVGKGKKIQLSCCGKGVVFGMEGTPGKWQEKGDWETEIPKGDLSLKG